MIESKREKERGLRRKALTFLVSFVSFYNFEVQFSYIDDVTESTYDGTETIVRIMVLL